MAMIVEVESMHEVFTTITWERIGIKQPYLSEKHLNQTNRQLPHGIHRPVSKEYLQRELLYRMARNNRETLTGYTATNTPLRRC